MPEMTSATGPAVALADGHVPADMTPASRRWTLALAGLGAFMSALDVVVVATALPTLRHAARRQPGGSGMDDQRLQPGLRLPDA